MVTDQKRLVSAGRRNTKRDQILLEPQSVFYCHPLLAAVGNFERPVSPAASNRNRGGRSFITLDVPRNER